MTRLPVFGFDACILALWVALDWAERRGRLDKASQALKSWFIDHGEMTDFTAQAAQEGELALMAKQGYAQNANGEFEWVDEEEL